MVATVGLTTGEEFLRNAARAYFSEHYGNPQMYQDKPLHGDIMWTPALRFVIRQCVNVFVEPSEAGPYPEILKIKHTEIFHFPKPIAVYSVCPENMISTSTQQSEMKRLKNNGFGLVTVNPDGSAEQIFSAVPLIQVISKAEFRAEIKGLFGKIRQRLSEAYDDYQGNPANGVAKLSEVLEGLVQQAKKDIVSGGHMSNSQLGTGTASVLDAMFESNQFKGIRSEIGGCRNYNSKYRNLSHHWPSNAKKAYEKYNDCRHAFLGGIKQIQGFREAMKKVNLSGNLPRV